MSLCLVRLIKPIFRSIEHRESGFLNMDLDFFKSFFKFSLSLRFRLGSTSDFCCFLSFLLQGFSLQTYELDLSKTNKSKSMALKSVDDVEVGGFDDELSATEIAYLLALEIFSRITIERQEV